MKLSNIGSQLAELLLEHIRVDAIANYYDVPELGKLATAKLKLILDENCHNERFLSIVQEAFEVSEDVSLRKLMAEVATAHIEECLKDDQLIINDFAFAIIENLVTKRKEQEKLWANQIEALRARLHGAELLAQPASNDKEQYEDYA